MKLRNIIFREVNYLRKLYKVNDKILNSVSRKTEDKKVNLHWWSTQNNGIENIGDFLSIVVCNYLLNKKGLSFNTEIDEKKHLYSIGSIIQGGAQNATIWGSGIKNGEEDISILMKKTRKLDIRLVRGPKTREVLIKSGYDCPKKYGDPALIMPLIYTPKEKEKKEYIVVLHHATERNIDNNCITPLNDNYQDFIDIIYNSKLVISSSLHGIILAEAYGIPAILLTDKVTRNLFKYDDYYQSTGRKNYPIANSIEEALTLVPSYLDGLEKIQKDIIETFPFDLWKKKNVN